MKILDKDIYDTMELVAEAYGGIGADRVHTYDENHRIVPLCLLGFCRFFADSAFDFKSVRRIEQAFEDIGINYANNNRAVYNRLGLPRDKEYVIEYLYEKKRISWREWCEELNVVRGE